MAGLLNHRRKNGIGRMNQKIDFYSLSGADDGQGGQTSEIEVSQLTGVHCEIQEMTGYKRIQFNQLVSGKPFEIRLRKRSDVTITDRLLIGIDTRRLVIHSVAEDHEYKGNLYITAVEKM